jgi:hypothetical protein
MPADDGKSARTLRSQTKTDRDDAGSEMAQFGYKLVASQKSGYDKHLDWTLAKALTKLLISSADSEPERAPS